MSAEKELQKIVEKYGKTHTIEKVAATKNLLHKLKDTQILAYGDGISYHYILTKKEIKLELFNK
jgi:hypothetical protein